ncbi:ABC transporter ATP-binding protein [Xanthobacter wiegelii]|uniref:ABC transporter ATP-binding protein n=1 Tax=Xanthobacter wiegelii TaxID=3119913 RepID=UPI00372C6724
MRAPLLQITAIDVAIDAMRVLRGFSLSLEQGQMIGLLGRNGAGKTTLLRAVMGHLPLVGGRIALAGEDLAKVPAHGRAARGVGYMPEDRRLVPQLTVEENILLPVWVSRTLVREERLELVYRVVPELKEMRGRKALLLSGGQQKLVALGRALAAGTRLLLLDEPFEGVAPALSARIAEVIAELKSRGFSVLLAQSDLNHAQSLFDARVVIERGANIGDAAAA